MQSVEPVVTGPETKYAGKYKRGVAPERLEENNLASWRVIDAILEAYGEADFWDLAVAVRGHKHYGETAGAPQKFVQYCINNGWLERV